MIIVMPAPGAPVTLVGIISTVLVDRYKCVNVNWDPDWQSLVDDGYMTVYDPPITCRDSNPTLGDGVSTVPQSVKDYVADYVADGVTDVPPRTSTVWGIGDSLTAHYVQADPLMVGGTGQPGLMVGAKSYIHWARSESQATWMYAGIFATPGYTAAQVLATHVPDLIAAATEGDTAIVWCGTNGVVLADVIAVHDALRTAKINTVAVSVVPHPSTPGDMITFNVGLRDYCQKNSVPYVDVHRLWVDQATGTLKAVYDVGDGLHPNEAGAKAAGVAIGQAVTKLFADESEDGTLPGTNIGFVGSVFVTKPLATGAVLGTHWEIAGSLGTGILGVLTDTDFVGGSCYQAVRGDTDFYFKPHIGVPVLTAGDTIRIGFALKTTIPVGGKVHWVLWNSSLVNMPMGVGLPTGGNEITLSQGISRFYADIIVPSAPSSMSFGLYFHVGGVVGTEVRVGEVAYWNLTAMGF